MRSVLPVALVLLSGCGIDLKSMLNIPSVDDYKPDTEVPTEDVGTAQDEEGRGGDFPAHISTYLSIDAGDVLGVDYVLHDVEYLATGGVWRSLGVGAADGTAEVELELPTVDLIGEDISGFRVSFGEISAMVDGVPTDLIVAPVEASGAWSAAANTSYVLGLTMTSEGGLVEDGQGLHWDTSLMVDEWSFDGVEDTGQ